MKKIAYVIVVWALAVSAIRSQEVRPSVSVIGEASVKISPDQVTFTFEIVTANKELAMAKRDNDLRSAKTLDTAKSFQINPENIQTDSLTISPQYTGEKDARGPHVLIGYEVTKRIFVILKDLAKLDFFMSRAIEAGVNRVVSINIENSDYDKHQERVRAMAVKNAREKAQAYAAQLGQTIGKAYVIREEEADTPAYTAGYGSGSGNGNGDAWADPDAKIATPTNPFISQVTFALGQIDVSEKVYVIFELSK